MTFKEIILVILGGVLANNLVFEKLMGVEPVLNNGKCVRTALSIGCGTAAVMLVASALVYPIQSLLNSAGAGFLVIPAAVAVILLLTYLLKLLVKKPMGVWFPLIALNSAVPGLCTGNADAGFGAAVLTAFGAAVGFVAALVLYAGVRGRIDEKAVPESFRGLPISLLIAFIISLALVAYK